MALQASGAGGAPALVSSVSEERASLVERKTTRRAMKIDNKLPAASAALAAPPRRRDFAADDEGRLEWIAKFNEHAGGLSHAHVARGTKRGRDGLVGLFGDYLEREGHGEYVKWQKTSGGGGADKEVVPLRDDTTGQIKVPDAEAVAEYVVVMATGDTTARPKGGTLEYRSAWHHASQPKALYLTEKSHGRGAYADSPMRFVSIEKSKEAISLFYDRVLQGTEGATNPATRPIVKSLMKVLSFLMGRRRKVVPKAMRKKVLFLVLRLLDLTNPTDVAVATYMTKNLIRGNRAADEFLLDWADINLVYDERWDGVVGALPAAVVQQGEPEDASGVAGGPEAESASEVDEEEEVEDVAELSGAAVSDSAVSDEELSDQELSDEVVSSDEEGEAATQLQAAVRGRASRRKLRREMASADALKLEAKLKGVTAFRVVTKKDRVQRGKVKPLHCVTGCSGKLELEEDGSLNVDKACPVHLMLYSKALQAKRMGVDVEKLVGPVFGDYELIEDVPAGALLVAADVLDAEMLRSRVKPGVMVVTRQEEQDGVAYVNSRQSPSVSSRTMRSGSVVSFIVDEDDASGGASGGAPSGTWFVVGSTDGYAVRAWGEASKVTQRMRSLMVKTNKRAQKAGLSERIEEPERFSSKSMRMGMATGQRGLCEWELTMDTGEWSDPRIARGYVEEEAPFEEAQVNLSDVMLRGTSAKVHDGLIARAMERCASSEVQELRERLAAAEEEVTRLRTLVGLQGATGGTLEERLRGALAGMRSAVPAQPVVAAPLVHGCTRSAPSTSEAATMTDDPCVSAEEDEEPTQDEDLLAMLDGLNELGELEEPSEPIQPMVLKNARLQARERSSKPCSPVCVPQIKGHKWTSSSLAPIVKDCIAECGCDGKEVTPEVLQASLCRADLHTRYKTVESLLGRLRAKEKEEKERLQPRRLRLPDADDGMLDVSELSSLVGEIVQVFVIGAKDGTLTLDVNLDGTVADAKEVLIEKLNGGDAANFRFEYGGREMDDEQVLRAYGVEKESTLVALGRLRGGCPSSSGGAGCSSSARSPTRSDVSDAEWLAAQHAELQAEEAAAKKAAEEEAAVKAAEEVAKAADEAKAAQAAAKAAEAEAAAKAATEEAASLGSQGSSQGEMAMAIEMSFMEHEDANDFVELPTDVQKALVDGLRASRREAKERGGADGGEGEGGAEDGGRASSVSMGSTVVDAPHSPTAFVKDELQDDARAMQLELKDALERIDVVNSSGDTAARAEAQRWLKDVLSRQDELQAQVMARDAEKAKHGSPSTSRDASAPAAEAGSSAADVTPIHKSKKARLHPPTTPSKNSVVVELSDDDEPLAAAEKARAEATRVAAEKAAAEAATQQMQVQMAVINQALLLAFASTGAAVARQLRELYVVLDDHQRRALYGIMIDKPRVAVVSAPAGAGKSALLKLISICWEHEVAVVAPTHGARRADQEMIDEVLERKSYMPRIEARTTYTAWGVGMGGVWDADVVANKILAQDRTKKKAKETYQRKVVVLDEAAQTHFSQLDMAAEVGPRVNGGHQQRFVLLMDGVQTPPVSTVNDLEGRDMVWESDLVREAEAAGELELYALEKVYRTDVVDLLELGGALRNEDFETAWPLVQKFDATVMPSDHLDVVHDNDETYNIATHKHGSKPGVQTVHARCVEGGPEESDVSSWSPHLRTVVRKASKMLVEVHVYPGQKLLYQPIGKKGAKTVSGWYLQKGEVLEVIRYDAVQRLLEVRCLRLKNSPRAFISEEEMWVDLGEEYGTVQLMGPPWWYEDIATVYTAQGSQRDYVHVHAGRFKGARNLLYTACTRAKTALKISGISLCDEGVDLREKMELHPKSVLWQVKLGLGGFSAERVQEAKLRVAQQQAVAAQTGG